MLIDMRSPRFALTPAIRRHAEYRLETAIGFAWRSVRRVAVTVDDVNSDRGGVDKVCRVVVHCRRGGTVVAEARHEDLYVAIDEATVKTRREVLTALRRILAFERSDRQRPGTLVPA